MLIKFVCCFLFTSGVLLFPQYVEAQLKQGNTLNADIFADAPYRMKITDTNGDIQPIPIHISVRDADGLGSNVELMSVDIRIKNADETSFGDILIFDTLSQQDAELLFIHRSPNDDVLDIQDFNQSAYEMGTNHTIEFKETHDFIDGEDYVEIEREMWYFTFLIPGEVIASYDDIIDIEVYFNIDWSTDDATYLRVFRYADDLPQINNWYRGDCHYHTMFTQNMVEMGSALDATKHAGSLIGLDWQFTTDHSCDFDNYGESLNDNWTRLGNQVYALNLENPEYVLIRGVEMSVNNSDGKVVHALVYPRSSSLFSLPFFGDGDGDASATDVYLSDLFSQLDENNGFCYAAHPFAEGDKLPVLVNGSAWNVCDSEFPVNDQASPTIGTVICNNPELDSDIFSSDPEYLFNKSLRGFQIWNLYNTLVSHNNNNYYDAWNVLYENDMFNFLPISPDDNMNLMYRLAQGFDVYRFLLQKGLNEKNANMDLKNWKAFIMGGSDAHGSFNYSNTDFYYSTYGDIEINALGRISTLAYCPLGMGAQGEHIVEAVYNGNTILSDGPIIAIYLSDEEGNKVIIGQDTSINVDQLNAMQLHVDMESSGEFGIAQTANLYIGTGSEEYVYSLPLVTGNNSYSLADILEEELTEIPIDEYFYVRADLETEKYYNDLSDVYLVESQKFHSFTNPIWLRVSDNTQLDAFSSKVEDMRLIYLGNQRFVEFNTNSNEVVRLDVVNTLGQTISSISCGMLDSGSYRYEIPINLQKGNLYFIRMVTSTKVNMLKVLE